MRFERLFEDLEGQFAHEEQQEVRAVSEELTRAERAQLTLADRLRGTSGRSVTLHLGATLRITGTVEEVGTEWLSLRDAGGAPRVIVPLSAIGLVQGLSGRARPPGDPLPTMPSTAALLRRIARDRSTVRLETTAGRITGRIAAVGADALEVHVLNTGEFAIVEDSARLTVVMASVLAIMVD